MTDDTRYPRSVRMTQEEWDAASAKAQELGFPDTSSWIRTLVHHGLTVVSPQEESAPSTFPGNLAERLLLRAALQSWKALEGRMSPEEAATIRQDVDALIRKQALVG